MKHYCLFLCLGMLVLSCNQPASVPTQSKDDSTQIVRLLKEVYQWHDKDQNSVIDFSLIVKDSFQVALNYDSLAKTIGMLQQTGYFSSTFITNYKGLADRINVKLTNANPKLLNEINFPFQDADPWTGFQDSDPNYWDRLIITNYRATADSASLSWHLQDSNGTTEPYVVRFTREQEKWRVAYLQGFDSTNY